MVSFADSSVDVQMRALTKNEFDEAMRVGSSAMFIATNQQRLKEYLAIAVRSHIDKFDTQQAAADKWNVSQPTISNIVNGNLEIVNSSYLLDILFKVGVQVEVTLR